jgi:uncharacterized protein YbbC (DUF1343 family)
VFFVPDTDRYKDKRCGGLSLTVTDPDKLNSVLFGLTLISILYRLYPSEFEIGRVMELLGNAKAMRALQAGQSPEKVLQADSAPMREFLAKRQKALIYDTVPPRKKERQ